MPIFTLGNSRLFAIDLLGMGVIVIIVVVLKKRG